MEQTNLFEIRATLKSDPNESELIDTASNLREARSLLNEYIMAFQSSIGSTYLNLFITKNRTKS